MPGIGSGPGEDTGGGGGGGGSVTLEIPTPAVGGGEDTFTFSGTPIAVFFQGVLQTPTVDYTAVGPVVIFEVAPASGLIQGLVSS